MTTLDEIKALVDSKNNAVQQRVGEKRALERRMVELDTEVQDLSASILSIEKAVWVLQGYADQQQKEVIEKVESVITSGLQAVFKNDTLEFKLYYSETKSGAKKKAPEITMAVFYECDGEQVKGDIKNSFGGGLSVVVATLLRIVFVMYLSGKVRPILFLDEPLRDLSPSYGAGNDTDGYRSRMAEFLRTLVDDAGIQVCLVSHEPDYSEISDVDYRFYGGIGSVPTVKKKTKDSIDGGM